MKQIKGIGFDLDGTLVDSLPGLAAAVSAALTELGFSAVTPEQVSLWVGNGATMLMQRALTSVDGRIDADSVAQARVCFERHYEQTINAGTALYPQVRETLEQLRQRGVPMAVITNKPTKFVEPLLQQLAILHYFSVVVGGDDVSERKPHPAPIYYVLAKLGLKANEFLFMGDSRNDIQAGQAAGCITVGITYGYNHGEPLALSQPNRLIDTFIELLAIIE